MGIIAEQVRAEQDVQAERFSYEETEVRKDDRLKLVKQAMAIAKKQAKGGKIDEATRKAIFKDPQAWIDKNGDAEDKQDDGADEATEKATYSTKQRQELAAKGQALPDGSYPIPNEAALKDAVSSYGRAVSAGKGPQVKRHIIKRAKALGKTDQLPDDWK